MKGKFKVLIDGDVKKYTNYNDIPEKIDDVIQCLFDVPKPPHTDEQHEEMEQHVSKINELVKRCKNGN